jgi:hypothetical protein
MEASIVDLRYKMNKILKALNRKEKVTVLYHGKPKGIIFPIGNKDNKKIKDHPFFGMYSKDKKSVIEQMKDLRGGRFNDI